MLKSNSSDFQNVLPVSSPNPLTVQDNYKENYNSQRNNRETLSVNTDEEEDEDKVGQENDTDFDEPLIHSTNSTSEAGENLSDGEKENQNNVNLEKSTDKKRQIGDIKKKNQQLQINGKQYLG